MRWLFLLLLVVNVLYLGLELQREAGLRIRGVAPIKLTATAKPLSLVHELEVLPAVRATDEIEAKAYMLVGDQIRDDSIQSDGLVAQLPEIRLVELDESTQFSCFSYGPIPDKVQATGLNDWFRSHGMETFPRHTEEEGKQLFWIYLAPQASRENAVAVLQDLQHKGVNDYRLINRGNLKNAISLGLFSSQSAVNQRLNELKDKGYKPVVVPYADISRLYWLEVKLKATTELLDEIFEAYPARFKSVPIQCDKLPIAMRMPRIDHARGDPGKSGICA